MPEDFARALSLRERTENKVFRTGLDIHWTPDGRRLWYRVRTGPATQEYVMVELATGKLTRSPEAPETGFQVVKSSALKAGPERASAGQGAETQVRWVNRLPEPVSLIWVDPAGRRRAYGQVAPGQMRMQHTYAGHVWLVADVRDRTLVAWTAAAEPTEIIIDGTTQEPRHREANTSPDGVWNVQFMEGNVHLRNLQTGASLRVTEDGTAKWPYRGPALWAPDSGSFAMLRVQEVAPRELTLVESAPVGQLQPRVRKLRYPKPGDDLPQPRPVLVRMTDKKPLLVSNEVFATPYEPDGRVGIRWSARGDEFYFDYNQRGHQVYRVVAVNTATGVARVVVEETAKTFIDYTNKTWRQWLGGSGELLWMSERDGWAHLWLYDVATGKVKQQITRGRWNVRKVLRVDEAKREAWFLASGVRAGEDPYQQHLARVALDGTGFTLLTQGDGDHRVEFSPDGQYFVDVWSRVDLPPVTELHRSDTGALVCELERGDASVLLAAGWSVPERFVAKARDGVTEIHGIIIKPSNFDPQQRYPVVEQVYAGPHGAFVPHSFGTLLRQHELAELGFVVVQADGMGTNHRGKAFHDVAWKNLRDAGFADRIAWIKAAAVTRPWMDLAHVGIYGGSAGGQTAMRALLEHHDFYHAAFADCGCHDNRMDKLWWNEQWLGWPVDESYARSSNVADAAMLKGRLMLCYGELDTNVDPASTLQVVHALEQAGKDFELLVITGHGHGAAETPYGNRRRMDFLVRSLMGIQPQQHP